MVGFPGVAKELGAFFRRSSFLPSGTAARNFTFFAYPQIHLRLHTSNKRLLTLFGFGNEMGHARTVLQTSSCQLWHSLGHVHGVLSITALISGPIRSYTPTLTGLAVDLLQEAIRPFRETR